MEKNVYQEVQFKKQMMSNLAATSNKFFRGLKTKRFVAEIEFCCGDFQMPLGDQLFKTTKCLSKKYPNFWIFNFNLICKMVNTTLEILSIFYERLKTSVLFRKIQYWLLKLGRRKKLPAETLIKMT